MKLNRANEYSLDQNQSINTSLFFQLSKSFKNMFINFLFSKLYCIFYIIKSKLVNQSKKVVYILRL